MKYKHMFRYDIYNLFSDADNLQLGLSYWNIVPFKKIGKVQYLDLTD